MRQLHTSQDLTPVSDTHTRALAVSSTRAAAEKERYSETVKPTKSAQAHISQWSTAQPHVWYRTYQEAKPAHCNVTPFAGKQMKTGSVFLPLNIMPAGGKGLMCPGRMFQEMKYQSGQGRVGGCGGARPSHSLSPTATPTLAKTHFPNEKPG